MSERRWWLAGLVVLLGAVGLLFLEMPPTLYVSVGAAGIALCFIAQMMELRETGATASVIRGFASCIALMFGVFWFFIHDHADWTLLVAAGGFVLFGFIALFAEFYEKSVELKRAVRRWLASRRG